MNRVILKPFSKNKFELAQDYEFCFENCKILIKSGFKTNGADIPRLLWSFFPPNSPEYLSAALIHDFLCENAYLYGDYKDFVNADKCFYECLKKLDVKKYKCVLFYASVRAYHFLRYKVFAKCF